MKYEWSGMDGHDAFALTTQRSPNEFPVGLYAWLDVHHFHGGGSGAFNWFADADECRAFIEGVLVVAGVDGQTPKNAAEASAALGPGPLTPESLQALDALRLQQIAFEWVGGLDDLVAGERAFERKVREAFRADEGDDAIDPDDLGAFVAFLGDYGL